MSKRDKPGNVIQFRVSGKHRFADWDAKQCLENCLEQIESGEFNPQHLVIIGIHDEEDSHEVKMWHQKVALPDAIAFVEVYKQELLGWWRYDEE